MIVRLIPLLCLALIAFPATAQTQNPAPAATPQSDNPISRTLKTLYKHDKESILDAVFETLTDDTLRQTVKVRNQERAKAIAFVGVVHNGAQHYGYLVAYLRLKGPVPRGKELQGKPEKQ